MVIFERNIYFEARILKTEMLSFLLKSETQSAIVATKGVLNQRPCHGPEI